MDGYVHVPVGCPCEGTPHEGHEIFLLPKLTFLGGADAARVLGKFVASLSGDITDDQSHELGVQLGQSYIRHQVVGWTLEEPFDRQAILDDWSLAQPVAEKADEIYSEAVLSPLVKAAATSSRNGRTARSTSPKRATSRQPRTP